MVDRYWRQIESIENDIENCIQISSILLKLKGYDKKLGDLSKIGDNENDISSNLSKINDNGKSISSNLKKIDNFTQYILKSGKDFEEKYIIEKQIFRFNKDKHFYTIFEKEIECDFTKNSLLFVKNNMYYKYENLSNDYFRLQHEYNIYDDKDNLIHKYLFNKDTYYDANLDPILHTGEDFCVYFKKDYKKIKLNLQLHRHNRHGAGNINSEIDDDNENYINIAYLYRNNNGNEEKISSNLGKINTNIADISTNLGIINTNKNNISSNLGKINNITKTIMLKNIHFTDFDSKDEAFTRGLISLDNIAGLPRSADIYNVNMRYYFKKDDVLEIDCKLMFQHSVYTYADKTHIYYDLYNQGKEIFRETRRYNQFVLINDKNRVIAYTKLL